MKTTFLKDCTGVVLAGGENRRMPVLKGFIEVGGTKIIERNLGILKRLFSEVFIITNQPELYSYPGVPMFGDIYNVRGPMSGIFTALVNASNKWIFVCACDMPFINTELVRYMASKREGFDIVAPRRDRDRAEPLFAFYSNNVLISFEKLLLEGNRGITDFLLKHDKRVKYITPDEIKRSDPDLRSFINLNTPEDVDLHLDFQDRLKFKKGLQRR
ncbi:MAG: molybdenum cofactor guanylyltransferase [Nitrospiraceae bacterium]|nr:MAG: molybdenum cofactor guanylyltransferase [Nitrospiraceae bacterium]